MEQFMTSSKITINKTSDSGISETHKVLIELYKHQIFGITRFIVKTKGIVNEFFPDGKFKSKSTAESYMNNAIEFCHNY